ncbi:MAG: hypothetical protein D3910_17295 [Candidatus Electrothrix sp. ATG2]|nr:hypothetical protein [Candidatus Electrothrix sp. ATG2]
MPDPPLLKHEPLTRGLNTGFHVPGPARIPVPENIYTVLTAWAVCRSDLHDSNFIFFRNRRGFKNITACNSLKRRMQDFESTGLVVSFGELQYIVPMKQYSD